MIRWLLLPALLALASISCVEIEGPDVVVTAEPVPEALEGARWQQLPVRYCIVETEKGFVDVAEFRSLTAAAFAEWGILAIDDGACRDEPTPANGVNEIGWGRPPEAQGGGGVEEAGYTRLLFRECPRSCGDAQNQIIEADIIIAEDPPQRWQNSRCLYTTLLHEVGHFLGVPHLDSPAVMASASTSCPQKLTEIDRAALDALYASD